MPTDNTTAPRDAPPERGERDELSTSHLATKNNAVNSLAGIISCISFALGIVWIFLFPLVTVTTGEAKPRGTFFDENAMLVHHTFMEMQPEDVDWALPGQLKISHDQVMKTIDNRLDVYWILTVPHDSVVLDYRINSSCTRWMLTEQHGCAVCSTLWTCLATLTRFMTSQPSDLDYVRGRMEAYWRYKGQTSLEMRNTK